MGKKRHNIVYSLVENVILRGRKLLLKLRRMNDGVYVVNSGPRTLKMKLKFLFHFRDITISINARHAKLLRKISL